MNTVDYRTSCLRSEWELVWVLENTLSVNCSQNHFLVNKGQMIFLNPNESHEIQKVDGGCTFACMQGSTKILPISPHLCAEAKLPHLYFSTEEMQALREQFFDVMQSLEKYD